jgi:hypothetical protein
MPDDQSFHLPYDPEKGVICEWLYNGRIGIFSFTLAEQSALELIESVWKQWTVCFPPNTPLFILFDLTHMGFIPPPVWAGGLRFAYALQAVPGSSAILLPTHPTATMIRLLLTQIDLRKGARRRRIFQDRQAAIDWLETCLTESPT